MYIKSKIFIAALILVFLISFTCVSAADNTTADDAALQTGTLEEGILSDSSGESYDTKTFNDLSVDVDNNVPNVELHTDYKFEDGYDFEDLMRGIFIGSDNVVIEGNDCTIDCSNLARAFEIAGENVTIRNINFVNGVSSDGKDGGAIRAAGNLTVIGCTFSGNHNSSIYVGGLAQIMNCTFKDNLAINGSAILAASQYCNVVECTFINNNATYGGAVYFQNNGHVINSSFKDNSATLNGGAVYSGTAVNCSFDNNNAVSCGGAMYNSSAEDCSFYNNTAANGGAIYDGTALRCNFTNNSADNTGGAIRQGSAVNCSFIGNSAVFGGALYGNSAVNCSFRDNSATTEGGAIEGSAVTVVNCTFINNRADMGSAINCHSVSCTNSVFLNNQARSISLDVRRENKSLIISFSGNDNYINAIYSDQDASFTNVTYWNGSEVNTDNAAPKKGICPGVNIKLEISESGSIIRNILLSSDENNEAHYLLDFPYGSYDYKAYIADDSYYTDIEADGNFSFKADSLIVISPVGEVVYNTSFHVEVTGQNLTKVRLTVYDSDNNVSYTVEFSPDVIGNSVPIPPLSAGQYNITVFNYGNDTVAESMDSILFNVLHLVINANDVKYGVGSPMAYQASVVDENGNPVSNRALTFTVGGKTYNATTNDSGIAAVNLSLDVGSYDVLISDGLFNVTKKITVLARIVENRNVAVDYDYVSFKVRAIGDDGNPIANAAVKMVVNGKTYNRITDKNGYATLNVNLAPKTYTIASTYKGYTVKNTIKVKSTLKAKKTFTVRKTAKKLVIKATLKRSNGKAISGKKVTFKFKGKKYSAKTNRKGIAKVTIKKNVIKKLKAGKKYALKINYKKEIIKSKVKVRK